MPVQAQEPLPGPPRPATGQELKDFCEGREGIAIFGIVGIHEDASATTFDLLNCAYKQVREVDCSHLTELRGIIPKVLGAGRSMTEELKKTDNRWEGEYGWAFDKHCLSLM